MIKVYYLTYETPRDVQADVRDALWSRDVTRINKVLADAKQHYMLVAQVRTTDLETAWTLLQNGVHTSSWVLSPPDEVRPLVKPIVQGGQEFGWRSADLGDIFESSNGHRHVCGVIGFVDLPPS